MPKHETNQLEQTVIAFLRALETRDSADALAPFYHPEAEQTEYPNTVVKRTVVRKLADLKTSAEQGGKLLLKEEYEIRQLYTAGDTVILEAVWRGTLAVPLGRLPAGGQMVAYFAQFFQFKDGKIYRQRNYDCFEPFSNDEQ